MTTITNPNRTHGRAAAGARPEAVTYRGVVYSWHMDHMGHMNVQHYVGMFDNASWVLLGMVGLDATWFRRQRCGMAAVEQNITYLREMRAGDLVEIRSGILEIGEKVVRIFHEMRNSTGDWVAARTTILAVYFDTVLRKSVPLPEEVRKGMQALVIREEATE